MKASLVIEVIGGDVRGARHWKARSNPRLRATPDQTWVAEVTLGGRRYLDYKTDYRNANGVGSRGVERHYLLESGHTYEVQRFVTWRREERYLCHVTEAGDIVRIEGSNE